MKILSVLFINILRTLAYDAYHNGHCVATTNTCDYKEAEFQQKLIFYDVNPPEGFNLRRDVYMRFAIMLAEARKRGNSNWHLVLPPWYNIYHWRSNSVGRLKPIFWNEFFNIDALKSYAPVLEMHEVFSHTKKRDDFYIDTLYVLQNFENAFENGEFRDKWRIVGPCEYDQHYWGYKNVTAAQVICVQFQGVITKLWELIALHPNDKRVMFSHGEIPLHQSYGTKTYWDCRKSMKFSVKTLEAADQYLKSTFGCANTKCTKYISVHWRRQDFEYTNRATNAKSAAKQIDNTIKNNSLEQDSIFIATDASKTQLDKLKTELQSLGYKVFDYLPIVDEFSDGQIAIIEQIVCSRGAYFIGTLESTFSYRIQEEREILGFNSDTTFNALCPDNGKCEKPSRWTIIH